MRLMTAALLSLPLLMANAIYAQQNELLKNPGFEEVSEGNIAVWDNTPVAAVAATDKVAGGKRSIRLSSDNADFAPIATQNISDFQLNRKYRLKYQALAAEEGAQYRVYVGVWKGTTWIEGFNAEWRGGKTDWEKAAFDFTPTKEADRLMVVLQIKGPATMWFDEISLVQAPADEKATGSTPVAGAPGKQMLINPSFENGTDSWSASPAGVSAATDIATDGKGSIKLTGNDPDKAVIATQSVREFELNRKYRLSYQARAAKFGQDYRVYIGAWKGGEWVTGIDSGWRQGQEAWQQVFVDFTLTQPADRLEIVLQVKTPGTMWFDNVSLAAAPVEVLPPPLAKFQGSPDFVQIMPDLTLRVRNAPFFPIKIWGWRAETEEAMAKAHDFGFNVIATGHIDSVGAEAMRLWLDAAHKHRLMMIPTARVEFPSAQAAAMLPDKLARLRPIIEKIKNHPALLGYNLSDEPVWGGYDLPSIAAGAHLIRELDPNHPIVINHAPRNTIDELRRYNRYLDITGSDIYPVWKTGLDKHSDLPNKTISVVGDEVTKNLIAVDHAKPVLQTLQAFSWSDNASDAALKDEPFPTHQQLRFMGYYSVVCGATGIAYFQDSRYQVLRPELKPIIREFAALNDVLAGGTALAADKVSAAPQVKILAKQWNGSRVVIAVNHTNEPLKAQLDWNTLAGSTPGGALKVLFENRGVNLNGGKFSDDFAPYDVHVYTDAALESKVLRAFTPLPSQVTAQANATQSPDEMKAEIRRGFDARVPREGRKNHALATGTKVSFSTELGHMKATHVNDGDRWGGQWNDATHNEYPDWVALTFPAPVEIRQIAIYSSDMQVFGQSTSDGIRDYLVQVENNGEWKTIHEAKNHDSVVSVINLPQPVTAQKLRIWVTATAGSGDYTRIREIEVY